MFITAQRPKCQCGSVSKHQALMAVNKATGAVCWRQWRFRWGRVVEAIDTGSAAADDFLVIDLTLGLPPPSES